MARQRNLSLIAAVLLAACAMPPATETATTEVASKLADYYQDAVYQSLFLDDDSPRWEEIRAQLPFDWISLNASGCYGICPEFSVEFRRDSSAVYEGRAFTGNLKGELVGTISISDYAQLCLYVEQLGFERLAAGYSARWTDDETITIACLRKGQASATTVEDYGRQAPAQFQLLKLAIDAQIAATDWRPLGK